MSAARLLTLLHGVRQYGNGWRADCPNGHTNARGPLSVIEADDGRVMLHCFACHDTPGILRALGLEMADLYPERVKDPSPGARKAAAETFKCNAWGAALGVLDREATVVLIAATDMHDGKALSPDDDARLVQATQRIAQVREVLRERT